MFTTKYLELDRLHSYPIVPMPDSPDCENSRLWMLQIVYWNALSMEGMGRRTNL